MTDLSPFHFSRASGSCLPDKSQVTRVNLKSRQSSAIFPWISLWLALKSGFTYMCFCHYPYRIIINNIERQHSQSIVISVSCMSILHMMKKKLHIFNKYLDNSWKILDWIYAFEGLRCSFTCHCTTESGDWEWGQTHWWKKLKAFITRLGFFLGAWSRQAGNKYETMLFRLTKRQTSHRDICLSLGLRWRWTFCACLMKTQPTEACTYLVRNCVPQSQSLLQGETAQFPCLIPPLGSVWCGNHGMKYFQTLILEKRQMLSSGNLRSHKPSGGKMVWSSDSKWFLIQKPKEPKLLHYATPDVLSEIKIL